MTRTLLFCISKDARPFVPTLLNYGDDARFYLVESKVFPKFEADFRTRLHENEDFDLASFTTVEECQAWALELMRTVRFVECSIIAIADAGTAQDGTVLIQWHQAVDPIEIQPYGKLPPGPANSWWTFRVKQEQASDVEADLNYVMDDSYSHYFCRTAEFTDESGVFDVAQLHRVIRDESGSTSVPIKPTRTSPH